LMKSLYLIRSVQTGRYFPEELYFSSIWVQLKPHLRGSMGCYRKWRQSFFCIFQIFSLFNLLFFCIFHIISLFNLLFFRYPCRSCAKTHFVLLLYVSSTPRHERDLNLMKSLYLIRSVQTGRYFPEELYFSSIWITKLSNSEQSYKGKVKTHKYLSVCLTENHAKSPKM
jgi:hypothetical protein